MPLAVSTPRRELRRRPAQTGEGPTQRKREVHVSIDQKAAFPWQPAPPYHLITIDYELPPPPPPWHIARRSEGGAEAACGPRIHTTAEWIGDNVGGLDSTPTVIIQQLIIITIIIKRQFRRHSNMASHYEGAPYFRQEICGNENVNKTRARTHEAIRNANKKAKISAHKRKRELCAIYLKI